MSGKRLPRWTPGSKRFVRHVAEALDAAAERAAHAGEAYRAHRARTGDAQAAQTRAGQEIGPLPPRDDPARWEACRYDLRRFLETYFPKTFYLAWSKDHLKVIARLQRAILSGGLFAFAMPRKGGKTSLAWAAALWAVLYGHRCYVVILAVSAERGTELMETVKTALTANEDLLADFAPEVQPFVALENEPRRCLGQRCGGRPTHIRWQQRRIIFGSVPESLAGGTVIATTGLTGGGVRGQQYLEPDGQRVIRPDLVLVDDPQNDEVARSPTQVRKRLRLLNGAVLGMAGHGKRIAAVATVTVICPDDVASGLLDREASPDWQGKRIPMLYALPKDKKRWEEYRRLRLADLAADTDEAGAFYQKHRTKMDEGARPSWPALMDDGERSAVQHAMNLMYRDEATFFAEYQNDPRPEDDAPEGAIRPADVVERTSGRPRGQVPLAATQVTAFIDIHDRVLFWCACAWEEAFTGHVIDYGTWPEQTRRDFTLRDAPRTLGRAYPGRGADGAILAGLEDLVARLLSREWPKAGAAGVVRLDRLLVDAGYKPDLVAAVKHKQGGSVMVLSKGVGITAARRPISAYRRKPGERYGHEWYIPTVRGTREFPHLLFDANWWKTFVTRALAIPPGDPGALRLFGRSKTAHRLFAGHIAGSETFAVTQGQGRTLREWKVRPSRPDNHWFDGLVGCAVAASLAGVQIPGASAPRGGAGQRRRYSRADLARRKVP